MTGLAPNASHSQISRGMGVFTIIWLGQVLSQLGSGLTGFALDVWVYQQTQSVTQYALLTIAATLPIVLISPLAGTLVDRWSRRWMMVGSSLGGGLSVATLWLFLYFDHLATWNIYLAVAANSIFLAFHLPAFVASVTLMVSPQQLGRASGMTQLIKAISGLVAPALGGILLTVLHLEGVILLDVITVTFAVVPLLIFRIPEIVPESNVSASTSLLADIKDVWLYLKKRPGVLAVLGLRASYNLSIGAILVLFVPFLLTITPPNLLGIIVSIAGMGMVVGGIGLGVWGNTTRSLIPLAFICILGSGITVIIINLQTSLIVITVGCFLVALGIPLVNGFTQALLQRKIAANIQGRTFAIDEMLLRASPCLAAMMLGPLTDHIFEPRLAPNGIWAESIGHIVGTGPGRGMAFLFILIGLFTILIAVVGMLYSPLQTIEADLPDHVSGDHRPIKH